MYAAIIIIVCSTDDDVFPVVWVSRAQGGEEEEEVGVASFNP